MTRRSSRFSRPTLAVGAAAALLAVGSAQATAAAQVRAEGVLSPTGPAFTYSALVPTGATARVHAVQTGSGTTVATLHVRGLQPHTTYAVHAHTGTCSTNPATSRGHYMDDPSGAVDPHNELWLGFTTNAAGNGRAQTVVEWQFRPGGAQSITFHQGGPTRVACLPVGF